MEGWIKLHRQLKEHWIWKSDNRLKWWIDILLTVNHSDSKVLVKGTLIECKRGQSIRSLEAWARDWNVTKGAVRDFFSLLVKDQMLYTESLKITTRITVCKYEDYQDQLHVEETQRKRKTNAKQTIDLPKQECEEEIKNDNNEKEIISNIFSLRFNNIWIELIQMPKWKKKPISAIKKSLDQLERFNEQFSIGLIEKAIAGNYQGVVFSNTESEYLNWKNKQNGTGQQKQQFSNNSNSGVSDDYKKSILERLGVAGGSENLPGN